jgi:hypothetical protein
MFVNLYQLSVVNNKNTKFNVLADLYPPERKPNKHALDPKQPKQMQNKSAERKLLKVSSFRKNNTGGGLGVIFCLSCQQDWYSVV